MFHSARIKLTGWYLLIIMAVSITFSIGMYHMLTREVVRFEQIQRARIERRLLESAFMPPGFRTSLLPRQLLLNEELVEETKKRILFSLTTVNIIICVVAGALGYILAGRTLRPIHTMLEEQKRFVSDASHEFRTPLTSIKTSIEVFLRDKHATISGARTLLEENMSEIDKLKRLSDNMLTLAQHHTKATKQFTTISTAEIIDKAIREVSPLAIRRKISTTVSQIKGTVHGDEDDLVRAIVTILDNAIKYSRPGGEVRVKGVISGSQVSIHIEDDGIGIEQTALPHIFDRFYRADSARSKNDIGGYGLGLAIAKNIITSHNGSINVTSVVGKGSHFTLRLPAHREEKSY